MLSVWHAWGAVLLVSAGGLPVAALVAWLLARTRPVRYAVAEVGAVAGTLPWLWMILTPSPGTPRRVSLVPFADLGGADAVVQIGGNLLVFAALGFFLPIRFPIGPWTVLLIAAAASTTVEILQYVLNLGRVSSVDDVLLNAAGGALFAVVSRLTVGPWSPPVAVRSGAGMPDPVLPARGAAVDEVVSVVVATLEREGAGATVSVVAPGTVRVVPLRSHGAPLEITVAGDPDGRGVAVRAGVGIRLHPDRLDDLSGLVKTVAGGRLTERLATRGGRTVSRGMAAGDGAVRVLGMTTSTDRLFGRTANRVTYPAYPPGAVVVAGRPA